MGFIYDDVNGVAVEGRRESFYLHDGREHGPNYRTPEFYNEDVQDIIEALTRYAQTPGVQADLEDRRKREQGRHEAVSAVGL